MLLRSLWPALFLSGVLLSGCAGQTTMSLDQNIGNLPALALMQGEATDGHREQVSRFLDRLTSHAQDKRLQKTFIVSTAFDDDNRWMVIRFHRMHGGEPQTGVSWVANIQIITSDLTRQDNRIKLRLIEMTNDQVFPGSQLSDSERQAAWAALRDDLTALASSLNQIA